MEDKVLALNKGVSPMITLDSHKTINYNLDRDDGFWIERLPNGYLIKIYIVNLMPYVPLDSKLDQQGQDRLFSEYASNTIITSLFGEKIEKQASFLFDHVRSAVEVSCLLDDQLVPQNVHFGFCQVKNLCALDSREAQKIFKQPKHRFYQMLLEAAKVNWLLSHKRSNWQGAINNGANWINQPDDSWQQENTPSHYSANGVVPELMVLANALLTNYVHQKFGLMLYRNTIQPDQVVCSHLPQGHSLLKLPVYGRFTSPLRSYGDLVNLRLLQAALASQPKPYAPEYLSALAKSLNQKEDILRRHGPVAMEEWLVKTDKPDDMNNDLWLRQQVQEQTIDSADLYSLVFRKKPDWWLDIIDYLQAWPTKAPSLLNEAFQGKLISNLDYDLSKNANNSWTGQATFNLQGRDYIAKVSAMANKKSAKQNASIEAIKLCLST
ncbi:MAG: RNB domain-containing ribonuclease [bacterium]